MAGQKLVVGLLLVALGVSQAREAGAEGGSTLSELLPALHYAEMLQAAELRPEQIKGLRQMQVRWLDLQRPPDGLAEAIRKACLQVAGGRTMESALRSLGVREQLGQAQEQAERGTQALAAELRDALGPEQHRALLAFLSPARGLAGLVEALRQMRHAPQPDWEQMRGNLAEALSGVGGPRATPAVPRSTIMEWLERAREMPDAEFEKAAPDLPGQWARALIPEIMRQVDDPNQQEQRLLEACRRLLTDPGGRALTAQLAEEGHGGAQTAPAPPAPE